MRGLAAALGPLGVVAASTSVSGIQMVIGELEKLQQTLIAEQKTDDKNFKDMECWCMRSNRDTTAKKEAAEKLLGDSKAIILEKTGLISSLEAQVKNLNKEIAEDEDTVVMAKKMRSKEGKVAKEQEIELGESITACGKALEVLSKVASSFISTGTASSLVQIVSQSSHFRDTIQKDLWDFLGQVASQRDQGFLQQDPTPPEGAKMVAATYQNSSGKVVGMLKQMHENFSNDLKQLLEEEAEKKNIFQALVKDKTESIELKKGSAATKTEQKGKAQQALSNAKADEETSSMDLEASVKFLEHVKETCDSAKDGHSERSSQRAEETAACNKAVEILTSDKARALFVKRGMSFLQVSNSGMTERRTEAMTLLLTVGKKTGDFRLSALAMNTRYNFSELIGTLKKLAVEKKETKEREIVKHDQCKDDFAKNASQTQTQTYAEEDATAEVAEAESDIKELTKAIDELDAVIAENNVEIGEATKTRKEENVAFVEQLEDMKATKVIVQEALAVLSKMYELLQANSRAQTPPKQSSYGKNQAGGAIVGLLNQLISSTDGEIATITKGEQNAQTNYETTVAELNEQNNIAQKARTDKMESNARAVKEKADAEGRRDEASDALSQLGKQKKALHAKCDFLQKNMGQRQDALAGEIEALKMAVATLMGARGLGA